MESPILTALRRVNFDPTGYLKATSTKERLRRALHQCPSPWALAQNVAIVNGKPEPTARVDVLAQQMAAGGQNAISLGAHQQFDIGRSPRKSRIEIALAIGERVVRAAGEVAGEAIDERAAGGGESK